MDELKKSEPLDFPTNADDPALLRVHVIQLGEVNYCFIYARMYCIYIYIQYMGLFKT